MSAKAIREYDGKKLLAKQLSGNPAFNTSGKSVQITQETDLEAVVRENDWLLREKLVAKPDQLIKRRGKSGLLLLNATWEDVKNWISERMNKTIEAGNISGVLKCFIVEPFVPHESTDEYYLCIYSIREGDEILFYHEGGVDIGDVDSKAEKYIVETGAALNMEAIEKNLLKHAPEARRSLISNFIKTLYNVYVQLHFTYLEINPFVVHNNMVYYLDLAAKLDQTAEYECSRAWGKIEFPAPFGRESLPEEAYIADLDSKTGASLKLTILNKNGRIWTMVAGGGASVVYSDAIAAHGYAHELANYGEYSGAPNESQTYEYSKTILNLMTRGEPRPDGKILIIGGGIANFTNVADTFKGIARALKEFRHQLINHKVKVYIRRGGPNYQEGLRTMRNLGEELGIPISVHGPETFITAVVPLALGKKVDSVSLRQGSTGEVSLTEKIFGSLSSSNSNNSGDNSESLIPQHGTQLAAEEIHGEKLKDGEKPWYNLLSKTTRSLIYGMQPKAVQGMLDFDHICGRKVPSVAGMIYPFGGAHVQKFYWGTGEILIPVYTKTAEAIEQNPDVDVIVNFASCRSVHESTMELLKFPQIRAIAIIAEGVPERKTKEINKEAANKGVTIIGPATVGGIKPGCYKIGNTGGMIDNILDSKLYRPGSVGYVSKSGGMSNELNNIVSRYTNGVYEGIAIGGDRYPGTTFIDHLLRYENDPECKILLLLGEVGGSEELKICQAIKDKKITKPLIAWCIGTCAKMFTTEVQFGHAGALAQGDIETADYKNKALREAGAIVPDTFEDLPAVLETLYKKMVQENKIIVKPEPEPPKVPIDFAWAKELGLIRKPANFISSISDDRGQELLYAGIPISTLFKENVGVGGVVGLLWFKRRLPEYACKFIEMILMLTADHGPAVSGAHNTIVTARAGKDLISSLCSGLLTIGDRFGGALDGAAAQFSQAFDQGLNPHEFVETMRKKHELILGIGHRIKSKHNPDLRVSILVEYVKKNFPATPVLDFALEVEKVTSAKKDNLILNVDGCIAVSFVDLMRNSGAFTSDEATEYAKIGTLNGLFVLGRSIGFIGHYLDQKRLKQGLYRHPADDITFLS